MSLKPMRTCSGKPALHRVSRLPLIMESPCPWVPWTWTPDPVYFPAYVTVTSPNPGQSVTFRHDGPAGIFPTIIARTRVVWQCGSSGLSVLASLGGAGCGASAQIKTSNEWGIFAGDAASFEPGDTGPKVLADGAWFRFGVEVTALLEPGLSVTLDFNWV